jgi:hypothetical protein
MGEWWKQLFGESEGKNGGGIFPAYAQFTTDLHSLGQYIQDGTRALLETFVTLNRHARSSVSRKTVPFVTGWIRWLAAISNRSTTWRPPPLKRRISTAACRRWS